MLRSSFLVRVKFWLLRILVLFICSSLGTWSSLSSNLPVGETEVAGSQHWPAPERAWMVLVGRTGGQKAPLPREDEHIHWFYQT